MVFFISETIVRLPHQSVHWGLAAPVCCGQPQRRRGAPPPEERPKHVSSAGSRYLRLQRPMVQSSTVTVRLVLA